MPIFDDPRKELNRLQRQLLEEEEEYSDGYEYYEEEPDEDDWLAEAKALLGDTQPQEPQIRNYANGYGRNPQPSAPQRPAYRGYTEAYEENLDDAAEEKAVRRLQILACLLTLGIVAVGAYWVVILL